MAVDTTALVEGMVSAGRQLGSSLFQNAEAFALPELNRIAAQIAAIGDNAADYTPEGARALVDMQVQASAGVIAAATAMALEAVQDAINAVLAAVGELVNGMVGFALFP